MLSDTTAKTNMYAYDTMPTEWYTVQRRPRSFQCPRPVSKNFNRISDFIFPDAIHVRLPEQDTHYIPARYHRADNYSLPILNRYNIDQHDMIIVERLPPPDPFDNIDLLYHEHSYQPHRPVRRRYSSYVDEHRVPMSTGFVYRPAVFRDRIRERRKRHTTDDAYHSILKSMIEEEEQVDELIANDPMNSYKETSPSKTYSRTSNPTSIPIHVERSRSRQRNSSISSRDSSSDTDTTDRNPITVKSLHQETSVRHYLVEKREHVADEIIHLVQRSIKSSPNSVGTDSSSTIIVQISDK